MNEALNDFVAGWNNVGTLFCSYAGSAFVQSALLIILLLAVDLLLRKRVRAVFRYGVWLLVLVKLVLPPTLSLPTGIGYWVGNRLPAVSPRLEFVSSASEYEPGTPPRYADLEPRSVIPPGDSPSSVPEASVPLSPVASTWTPVTWQAVVVLLWLTGVLAFTTLLAQRLRFVRGLVAASPPAGDDLRNLLEECRRQMGVRRPVGLRMLDTLPSPAVCGLWRPIILMPATLVERLAPEGLRAALIHELAHIRRADLWVNAVQTFLQVTYFYNPFVWLANARIRRTCEEAVDETVLVTLGGQAKSYSNTLIDISEMAFWKADFGLRLIGVAESRKALQGRIKHMLTRPIPQSARIGALGTIIILIVAAVLLPMARAERANKNTPVTSSVAAAGASENAPVAGESDTIVDPKTGLRFTVAGKISAENDVIVDTDQLRLSPNARFLMWRGEVIPLDGRKVFKLEALHGARDAAWSPDGKLIAYRDKLAIWLLPVSPETCQATGPARKLLDDRLNWREREILWSRDSEWILLSGYYYGYRHTAVSAQDGRPMQPLDYTRFSLPSPDQKSLAYFKPRNGVWTVPVEGGASRLAAGFDSWRVPESAIVPLWWSPDGDWLLCGSGRLAGNYDDLRLVCLADHHDVPFTFPEQLGKVALGVSPDGKKLQVYKTSYKQGGTFKVAPTRGGGPTEPAFCRLVGINRRRSLSSPDGQRWFFIGYKDGEGVPYVATSATADPVELKLPVQVRRERSINDWAAERWLVSPDGKRLVRRDEYVTREGMFSDLYVIPISLERAESTGSATLIFKEWRWGSPDDMVWSPDSSRLAIPSTRKVGGLWVVPTDGGTPKQLTESPEEYEWGPKWSPDGKLIAYGVESTGGVSLCVIPAEGGVPKRLWTRSGSYSLRYAWFPDSREIGLMFDDALLAVAVEDGSVRPFLKLAEAGFTQLQWFQWSPDGRTLGLYGAKDEKSRPIALFHASDKRIEILPDLDEKSRPDWTGDSQAIFYYASRPEKVRPAGLIYEVDVAEAWTQAKNSVTGEASPPGVAPAAEFEAPPLVNGEYRNDFESGDTKYWTFRDEWSGSEHVHDVQNGELLLENTRATIGVPEWTNYVVTVKMRLGGFLTFRSGERGEYRLSVLADKLWLGIRYTGTNRRDRTGVLAEPLYNFGPDKWYTVQVEVKGPHIVARVNGQPLIGLDDESCPRGPVALTSGVGTRVPFDDFSVRLLR